MVDKWLFLAAYSGFLSSSSTAYRSVERFELDAEDRKKSKQSTAQLTSTFAWKFHSDRSRIVSPDPRLIDIALHRARKSARLSSCINFFLTVFLAATALLSKWAIIQPIHNEIVRKSRANETLFYEQNHICRIINLQDFNVLTFPIACFLILVFTVCSKRTSFMKDKCRGYGAAPMPLDFLSHFDRKFAGVIFAVCVDELIMILQQALNGGSTKGEGVIVRYLLRLLQVLVMGLRYYPFLAAVYINSITTLLLGTLYAWLDYSVTIVNQGMCQADFYPTLDKSNSSSIDTKLEYYGTGSALIAIQLCTDIPRFMCLAYISVKIPMLLLKKLYYRCKKDLPMEKRLLLKMSREERIFRRACKPNSIEMIYVRNLFRSATDRPRSHHLVARLLPKFIYEWRDDFRFSSRIICVYSSLLLLLYYVTIQAFVRIIPVLDEVQKVLQILVDVISDAFYNPVDDDPEAGEVSGSSTNFPFPNLIRPYIFAVFITFFIILIQLLVLLANIRRNLFQAFRGDDSEIPRRQRSKYVSYSSGNVHFGGYFIGYLIWGFIIVAVVVALLCFSIEAFITFGNVRLIESFLRRIIPSFLFVFFKQYLNKLLAQYVFLQHQGQVLALNNRRALMIFIYFNFFLDAFLGFVSSLIRLVKSLIGGVLYMCRLDYSPLGRKLEGYDGGFNAYCGFIHTECTHRHPVMLVFASYLYTQMRLTRLANEQAELVYGAADEMQMKKKKLTTRYTRKWKLAVFLIRNPSIVFFRKAFLNQFHLDDVKGMNDFDGERHAERRMSAYARRMATSQLIMVSEDGQESISRVRLWEISNNTLLFNLFRK